MTAPFYYYYFIRIITISITKNDSKEAQKSSSISTSQDSRVNVGCPVQAGTVHPVGQAAKGGPLGSDDCLETGHHGLVPFAGSLVWHWREVSKVFVLFSNKAQGIPWKPAVIF